MSKNAFVLDTESMVARLREDVRVLTKDVGFRDRSHPLGLKKASRHIQDQLKAAGLSVALQEFVVDGSSYDNVIGALGPSGGKTVVIGAHYDAVSGSPGADDNASGVAGLLEVGRLLAKATPTCRIELAAYSLEESAFATDQMGSIRHAQSLRADNRDVRAMISLEMIGFYSDREGSQGAPDPSIAENYPKAGNFLMVVGRPEDADLTDAIAAGMREGSALPVYTINAPRAVPGIDLSDHRNFWDAGYSAAMITDTGFYRNPHYHMATDALETLDFGRMALAVQGIAAAVTALAR